MIQKEFHDNEIVIDSAKNVINSVFDFFTEEK